MALFEFKVVPDGDPPTPKKRAKTMDVALVILLIVMLVFTAIMIWVFIKVGSVPDSLVTAVFAVCGGECGVMGWIKTTKDKQSNKNKEEKDDEY